MTKEELTALGLTDEQRHAVQELHQRDIQLRLRREADRADAQAGIVRGALKPLLYMLHADSLQQLFIAASNLYAKETTGPAPEKKEE